MAAITITIRGLKEIRKKFAGSDKIIERELHNALQRSVELVQDRAKKKVGSSPTVYTGELSRSITNRVTGMRGVVGTDKIYAPVVEFGRDPGGRMPPTAPIERWARLKLGKKGIGFQIARKIARKGTKPQPYFQPAIDRSEADINKIFDTAIDNIIESL